MSGYDNDYGETYGGGIISDITEKVGKFRDENKTLSYIILTVIIVTIIGIMYLIINWLFGSDDEEEGFAPTGHGYGFIPSYKERDFKIDQQDTSFGNTIKNNISDGRNMGALRGGTKQLKIRGRK